MAASGQEETGAQDKAQDGAPSHADEAGEGGVAVLDDPTQELQARIQELEGRLRSVSNAFRQSQEDIASTKERLARQATVQEEIRRGEVVASLFEPVENLHRSIESAKGTPVESGLRMVHLQFMDALKKLGLEEVPGAGARFDPNVHEAIATAPVAEESQDNRVLSVYSAGYRIGQRLIRPARVILGSYTPPVAEA